MTLKDNKELEKYRNLVQACLDYCLLFPLFQIKTNEFNYENHFNNLKIEVEEAYQKGSLKKLKQYAKDLIEPFKDTHDAAFNSYILTNTGINLGIAGADLTKVLPVESRIDAIIENNKISSKEDYEDIISLLVNVYKKIEISKAQKLQSLVLQYQYQVLRNENGERYSEIVRRSKTKRRRKYEHYVVMAKMSPDKLKVAEILESHVKDGQSNTSISINYATGGGCIFHAYGIDLDINLNWRDSKTLIVEFKKGLNISIQKKTGGFNGDWLTIIYNEL